MRPTGDWMNEEEIRRILIRCIASSQKSEAGPKDVYERLFNKQLGFAQDKAKHKAALCTRRAGKSELAATRLFKKAKDFAGSTVPYIALTRDSARRILWPVLNEINEKFELGFLPVESKLMLSHPQTGSTIQLFGADMKNFIRRLRGGKYPLAVIDEAQAFGAHLEELIDDILIPATVDYDGEIDLYGTPGPIPKGYFFDATTGKNGFKAFSWSILDNPHIPNALKFIEELKKRKSWSDQNPTFLREWRGEWVFDLDALVYKYKEGRNDFTELPKASDWNRILSVDYGFNDKTAFAVISYNYKSPEIFLEHAEAHAELIPSQIAGSLMQLVERFKPSKIIADTGGLGKSITEEMIRRYGIPIKAAEKRDKLTWISLLNGDLIDGNLKIHVSLKEVREQMQTLTKADDGSEDPTLPNDMVDALLYSYKEAKAYAFEPEIEKPKSNEEKWEREAARLLEEDEKLMIGESALQWWER